MANLERDEFAQHLNTTFHLSQTNPPLGLQLIEVSEIKRAPGLERFWLVFSGPKELFLPQGTHQFHHENLSDFEMFTVPIREDENGYYYEVIFNRFVEEKANAS